MSTRDAPIRRCFICENEALLSALKLGVEVVEDFMPSIGKCALQDYGRLNQFLVDSKKLTTAAERSAS